MPARAGRESLVSGRYLSALAATVSASAAPYGYTLTIWTSGAVLAHARGLPTTVDALLFLLGAVTAFAVIALAAVGGVSARFVQVPADAAASRAAVWGALHFVSVGLAIAAAATIAHLVNGTVAWPLGGLLATAIYLLASALQLVVARIAVPRYGDSDVPGASSD